MKTGFSTILSPKLPEGHQLFIGNENAKKKTLSKERDILIRIHINLTDTLGTGSGGPL